MPCLGHGADLLTVQEVVDDLMAVLNFIIWAEGADSLILLVRSVLSAWSGHHDRPGFPNGMLMRLHGLLESAAVRALHSQARNRCPLLVVELYLLLSVVCETVH